MSRNLRKKPRVSYAEPEEPSPDEYVFCADCGDYVYEYCAIHGALLVVPDDKVPSKSPYPPIVPRAALTIPHVFLHLAPSIIPGAGLGVFATLTLPSGVRFGPYRGQRADDVSSSYCWQMYDGRGRRAHVIDAGDAQRSNWMRYVNCSRHWCEQNLVAFQYRGQLYYRTIKIIPRFTELMVFYGAEFANELGVNIRTYNSPSGYAQKFGAPAKKFSNTKDKKAHTEASKQIAPILNQAEKADCDTDKGNQQRREEETKEPEAKKQKTQKKPNKKKYMPPTKKSNAILNEQRPQNNQNIEVFNNSNNKHINNVLSEPAEKEAKYTQPINKNRINANKLELNTKHIDVRVSENLLQNNLLCEICNYETKTKLSLEKHLNLHTQDKNILKCSHCGYMTNYKSHLICHLKTHTGEKPFACKVCDYKCIESGTLKCHMRTHTGEKPFACKVCDYKCTQSGVMKNHMRTHTGEKPFACKVCDYKCITRGNMKIHMRTHTGEKPFACKVCDYKCITRGSMKCHMRTHTGEKPFTCKVCDYKCITSGNLRTHLRTHTGEKPFACKVCDYKCITRGNMKRHMRTHTGEKPFAT